MLSVYVNTVKSAKLNKLYFLNWQLFLYHPCCNLIRY